MFRNLELKQGIIWIIMFPEPIGKSSLITLPDIPIFPKHFGFFFDLKLLRILFPFFPLLILSHFIVHLSPHFLSIGSFKFAPFLLTERSLKFPPLLFLNFLLSLLNLFQLYLHIEILFQCG